MFLQKRFERVIKSDQSTSLHSSFDCCLHLNTWISCHLYPFLLNLKMKELRKMTLKASSYLKHFMPCHDFYNLVSLSNEFINNSSFLSNFSNIPFNTVTYMPSLKYFLSFSIPTRLAMWALKESSWLQNVLTGQNAVF